MKRIHPRVLGAITLIAVGGAGLAMTITPIGVVFATEGSSGGNQVNGNVASLPQCGVALQGTSAAISLGYSSGGTDGKYDGGSNYTLSGADASDTRIYSYSQSGAPTSACAFWTSVSQKTASVSLSGTNVCYKTGSALIYSTCSSPQKSSGYLDAWGFYDNTTKDGKGLSFIVDSTAPISVNDTGSSSSGISCDFSMSTPSIYGTKSGASWTANSGTLTRSISSISSAGNCSWKNVVSIVLPTKEIIASETGVTASSLAGLTDTLYGPVITSTIN